MKRHCSVSTGIQVWLLADRKDTILISIEENKLGNMVHFTLSLQNVGPASLVCVLLHMPPVLNADSMEQKKGPKYLCLMTRRDRGHEAQTRQASSVTIAAVINSSQGCH